MPTVLVTGATGKQGAGLVAELLRAGASVHALTRDAQSPAAQALAASGARVFEGAFTSASSLAAAAAGCDGLFLNTMPLSASGELADAQAVIDAALAAGVRHAVYASVMNADWADGLSRERRDEVLPPGSAMDLYYAAKTGIERAVRDAGFARWTVLRPAMFFTNFLAPGALVMYPALRDRGTLYTGLRRDLQMAMIDPADVGKFAAKVFCGGSGDDGDDGQSLHGRTIDVAAQNVTIVEMGATLARVAGRPVRVVTLEDWTEEDHEEAKKPSSWAVQGHLLQNDRAAAADLDEIAKLGVETRKLDDYMLANKDKVVATVGPF